MIGHHRVCQQQKLIAVQVIKALTYNRRNSRISQPIDLHMLIQVVVVCGEQLLMNSLLETGIGNRAFTVFQEASFLFLQTIGNIAGDRPGKPERDEVHCAWHIPVRQVSTRDDLAIHVGWSEQAGTLALRLALHEHFVQIQQDIGDDRPGGELGDIRTFESGSDWLGGHFLGGGIIMDVVHK